MSQLPITCELFALVQAATPASPPWLSNPDAVGGYLGAGIGIFGGIYGTLVGLLAPRGKCKAFIFGLNWAGFAIGLTLVAIGCAALVSGQPFRVWYSLGFPGALLTVLLVPLTFVVKQRYREAEHRKLEAEAFRRG